MKAILNKLKKLYNLVTAYIPEPLPIGMTEFNSWYERIIALTDLPNNDSTRFALASAIAHQPAAKFSYRRIYFARLLSKGAANQIAFGVMDELKQKQAAMIEAAKQAEVTAQDGQGDESQVGRA